jgi:hypothetical protein
MPYRVNPLVSAAFIGSLAAAMFLCLNWAAWAAGECISRPDQQINQLGHWYYYADRVHHRRCWFFEPKATVSPASSADRVPAPNTDSQQSWFSRFASDVAKTFSIEPQQTGISAFSSEPPRNSIPDNSSTAAKLTSSKYSRTNKTESRERSQIEPPLPPAATSGVASTERQNQSPQQAKAEKNEKPSTQLTDTEREALFDDFLKWYRDRSIFGSREH